jgi:histidinol-phosphate aminotransferase
MSEWPNWLPLRDELRSLSPYGAPQIDSPTRLNTNENPYPLSESLQNVILGELNRAVRNLNRYPDRDATELRTRLAAAINSETGERIDLSQVWAANGSNEIIQTICLAFSGDAMGFEPSYSMHPLISKSVGKKWVSVKRDDEFNIDVANALDAIFANRPGLIFVTTPNNPTGGVTPLTDIERLAKAAHEVNALLLIDEAYAEFSSERSALGLIKDFPNVLVSRTMSKAFAFAGARLGYVIANKLVIDALQLVRLPYHLSSLTQAAALAALQMRGELVKDLRNISAARDELSKSLTDLGLKVYPSQANFLLFTGFSGTAGEVWQRLVERGVLIRDIGIPGHLRVTIGTRAENRAFLDAITNVIRG